MSHIIHMCSKSYNCIGTKTKTNRQFLLIYAISDPAGYEAEKKQIKK